MQLYIANLTSQDHDFTYRVPAETGFTKRLHIQKLRAGMQQLIHTDAPPQVLEAIVDQHRIYGLVPVAEATKRKGFVGFCYSFDKPVSLDVMKYSIDHNKGVQDEKARENREIAAIAVDQTLQSATVEAQRHGVPLPALTGIDVEFLEDEANPTFAEAIRVDHGTQRADGKQLPTRSGRSGRRDRA